MTEEFFNALATNNSFSLKIDESTGAADGFALDFIRLLVNRKWENTCKGDIQGKVLEKDTDNPLAGVKVKLANNLSTITDSMGVFGFRDVPAGFELVSASFPGYADAMSAADIGAGDMNPEVIIYLEKGKNTTEFGNRKISVGETIRLNNILFDLGKADLKNESKIELDKVLAFLQNNLHAEIELSGHTSSEGEPNFNRSLSYLRVKACKDYILTKGIDPGRIIAIGFGPDRPVAPNDTGENRSKNRRVEMRISKL